MVDPSPFKKEIIPLPVEFGNKCISRDALLFNSTVHARCNLQGVGTRELRNS